MIKIVNAKSAGECTACHQSYAPGTVLLVTGDGKDAKLLGCANCQSLQIKAKIARVSGQARAYPCDRDKYKCEACGKWDNAGKGKIIFKVKIDGEKYPSIAACENCSDLSPAERAKIAAGPTDSQRATLDDKSKQAEHTRTQKAPENEEEALRRLGTWAEAAKTLAMDPTLPAMAKRRGMDLSRLMSVFANQATRDLNSRDATMDSWMTAFRDALQLGTYPSKGSFAESYLITRKNSKLDAFEVTLQTGYKCVSSVILSVRGTKIQKDIVWPCQAVLGNLAAPYHAAVRNLRRAEKARDQAYLRGLWDPRPVEEAKDEVQQAEQTVIAAGEKMLARIAADVTDANQKALRAALALKPEIIGRPWYSWEWYRFHQPTDLLILDYPSAAFWSPPEMRNQDGVIPSAACCLIERQGAPPIAIEVPADTVKQIAVKGRNATINGKGGLTGDTWGDNQGSHWMWEKTALIQLAVHGRFPLREIDPERAAILSRTEAAQEEETGGSYLAATVADAARHQSERLRQRQHPVPQLEDGGAPGEEFEWDEREPEHVPVGGEQSEDDQEEYPEPGSQG